MQKIVQFGKVEHQSPEQRSDNTCLNCLRLQAEIEELKDLLRQKDSLNQRDSDSDDYDRINIKAELIDIREKYGVLERNMQKMEQENDDLFTQNTQLQKKLALSALQVQGYEGGKQTGSTAARERSDKKGQDKRGEKQLQVSLFIERQKVANLEQLTRNQSEEIVKLKQLLRKRNALQGERHKLLEQLQSQGV